MAASTALMLPASRQAQTLKSRHAVAGRAVRRRRTERRRRPHRGAGPDRGARPECGGGESDRRRRHGRLAAGFAQARPTARNSCSATTAPTAGASRSTRTRRITRSPISRCLGSLVESPRVIIVPKNFPANTLQEFIAYVKANQVDGAIRPRRRGLRLACELHPAERHARRKRRPTCPIAVSRPPCRT